MKNLFKALIDFIKGLFKKEEPIVSEPSVESGETITVTEPIHEEEPEEESGTTEETITLTGKKSNIKILIDNGHGTNTPGKRSPWCAAKAKPEIEFYEYKWNREIAKPIVDELVRRGYDAELLVKEENDISLTERANRVNAFCKKLGAANCILVSVHSNAAGNGSEWMKAKGWSAYTTKGTTKSDKLAEALYDEAEKNFKGRAIRKDMSDGDRDWEANFTIIYKSLCPSVLTENFFYDNPDDVSYILSASGREAVIKTHVDGIINYIKSLK